MKGTRLGTGGTLDGVFVALLERAVQRGAARLILAPIPTPAGDSYAYATISDPDLLKSVRALPPVMPGQGARALASIAQALTGEIIAVMRPCEVKAAIELAKLEQVDLSSVTFLSMDCPGATPLEQFLDGEDQLPRWPDADGARPVCSICESFADSGDLHVATLGQADQACLVIPLTGKGSALADALGLPGEADADSWEKEAGRLRDRRSGARAEANGAVAQEVAGLGGLTAFFNSCVACHNCRSVCPICYCRRCYIDGDDWEAPSSEYLDRAHAGGSLRMLPDTVTFHVGRMAHMSLSCVSCGSCEDACPSDIRIAQLFCMVGDRTRELFDYEPGSDSSEPIPLATYEEEELHAYES